jgi:hypothetical protein
VLPGEDPRQGGSSPTALQFANNFHRVPGNKDLFESVAWLVRDPEGVGHRNPASCPA